MSEVRLMGAAEIAQLLGVSPSRVHQILRDDPTFPAPMATLSMGKVWRAEAVEEWHARRKAAASAGRGADRHGQWTLGDLYRELDRYEQTLLAEGMKPAAGRTEVDRTRRFLRWLGGDDATE
jgi:predicted DNA-binding transcriptional regulator AlpA